MKLTPKDKVDIIRAYTEQLIPMIELAEKYGMTRQGVHKMLKLSGVDTTKRKWLVSCSTCGEEIERNRCAIRKQLNHFCCVECYYAFLEAGNGNPYIQSRQGQRIARIKVAEVFDLLDTDIVHHEDRNTLNNQLWNLRAFRNQGDHIRHHRGFTVEPRWNGAELNP